MGGSINFTIHIGNSPQTRCIARFVLRQLLQSPFQCDGDCCSTCEGDCDDAPTDSSLLLCFGVGPACPKGRRRVTIKANFMASSARSCDAVLGQLLDEASLVVEPEDKGTGGVVVVAVPGLVHQGTRALVDVSIAIEQQKLNDDVCELVCVAVPRDGRADVVCVDPVGSDVYGPASKLPAFVPSAAPPPVATRQVGGRKQPPLPLKGGAAKRPKTTTTARANDSDDSDW